MPSNYLPGNDQLRGRSAGMPGLFMPVCGIGWQPHVQSLSHLTALDTVSEGSVLASCWPGYLLRRPRV